MITEVRAHDTSLPCKNNNNFSYDTEPTSITRLSSWPMGELDPAAALAMASPEFGEHGGVNMSIENSITFTVMEAETMRRMFEGELGPERDFFIYSRHFNPTVMALSRQMAALEGTEAAYCTSSGMAAVSPVLLQLVSSGGHIVASRTLYGGTHALLSHFLPRVSKITTTFVDVRNHEMVRDAMVEGKTKVHNLTPTKSFRFIYVSLIEL